MCARVEVGDATFPARQLHLFPTDKKEGEGRRKRWGLLSAKQVLVFF